MGTGVYSTGYTETALPSAFFRDYDERTKAGRGGGETSSILANEPRFTGTTLRGPAILS